MNKGGLQFAVREAENRLAWLARRASRDTAAGRKARAELPKAKAALDVARKRMEEAGA